MNEYQDIADALKMEYGHPYTAHGETRYDFSRHVYAGRAGALLLKAGADLEAGKAEVLRLAAAHAASDVTQWTIVAALCNVALAASFDEPNIAIEHQVSRLADHFGPADPRGLQLHDMLTRLRQRRTNPPTTKAVTRLVPGVVVGDPSGTDMQTSDQDLE